MVSPLTKQVSTHLTQDGENEFKKKKSGKTFLKANLYIETITSNSFK